MLGVEVVVDIILAEALVVLVVAQMELETIALVVARHQILAAAEVEVVDFQLEHMVALVVQA
jgi:hypothetical protein